ncbi:MAG: DsbA family oxidoreductase [Acidimicrobiales bacterium]
MTTVDVMPGTIVVYSDLGCPWAHLAVFRLLAARTRLGLDGAVVLDHRAFPLEVVNRRPTPYRTLAAEVPVVGGLDPSAGWQVWQGEPWTWPVTTLLALEAVQAAKAQSMDASERLDRALRLALFAESRCISMRHVVLDVAGESGLDAGALAGELDSGGRRKALLDDCEAAGKGPVKGSPHVFLPDGTNSHNPGIEMAWSGPHGSGFPVVSKDDPAIYEDLVMAAIGR